jgi:CRP/FNR family transcriptional regulator, anaerobic regulatory protein
MNELLQEFGFSEEEITIFWANAQSIVVPKRDILLRENQINRYLYFVKKGVIRAYVTDKEGKDYTKSFFYAAKQDFALSYPSFMFQQPSNLFLEAVMDSEVWAWHYSYIHKKLETDFRFFRFFRHCTDLLYVRFEQKDIRMLRSTPEERYIFFREEHPDLIHTIPLHYIATYLGITAETLSRIRKRVGNE